MTKNVLIVEDDPFIAMEFETEFLDAGFAVIGPVGNVQQALEEAKNNRIDFASLDYNLGHETSAPIAHALDKKGVRFVYVTGRARHVEENDELPKAPVFSKPVSPDAVIKYIQKMA